MASINEKINYINNTKLLLKNMINYSGVNITDETTFRNYVTKLYDGYIEILKNKNILFDNMPKATSTGYTNNAANAPIYENIMSKESTQNGIPTLENPVEVKTVKGYKNWLPNNLTSQTINGIEITVNEDKTVTLNGTSTNATNIYLLQNGTDILEPDIYTIYCKGRASGKVGIYFNSDSSTRIGQIGATESDSIISKQVTISENTTLYSAWLYIPNGVTLTNLVIKSMLLKGTEELPYVPYGNNYILYKQNGKNLINNLTKGIRLNATTGKEESSANAASSDYISVNFNKYPNYYLSGLANTIHSIIWAYNSNKEGLGRTGNLMRSNINLTINSFTGGTAQGTGDIAYIRVCQRVEATSTGTIDDIDNAKIQLEQGSTETTYEPYKENIVTIPLNGNEIAGKGDYKDELIVDKNGKCWLNKKLLKYTLNGTTNKFAWKHPSITSETKGLYRADVPNKNTSFANGSLDIALCNYFNLVSGNAQTAFNNNESGMWWNKEGESIYFILDKTSLTEANNWLTTHNTDIYYPSETPQLIDLNYTVNLVLFKGINNITNSENGSINIQYVTQLN